MTLDEASVATTVTDLSARGHGLDRRSINPAAPASLVLFVGPDLQSSQAAWGTLLREGMRSLWVAGLTQALGAAGLARFDAAVIDAAALGNRGAVVLVESSGALRCPLIVVANRADEIDEIVALEVGAQAYLVAPVTPRRLRAHLAAAMRRSVPAPPAGGAVTAEQDRSAQRTAGWHLDSVGSALRRGPQRVALTQVQFALLQCLIAAHGLIVPRTQLACALPNLRRLSARTIDVYLHRLRRRLCDGGVDDLTIEAVRARGYRLVAILA